MGVEKSNRIITWKMVYKRHKNGQIGTTMCPGPRGTFQIFLFTIVLVGGNFLEVIPQIY